MLQQELADAVGAFVKTVSRWENDRQTPRDADLEKLAAALEVSVPWLHYGIEVSDGAPSADPVGSAATSRPLPRVLRTHRVRVWLSGFRHELTRVGASEEQIAEAMDLLTAPQVFTYYRGGAPGEVSEEEAIVGMEAIAKFIRQRLRKRGLRFTAAESEVQA